MNRTASGQAISSGIDEHVVRLAAALAALHVAGTACADSIPSSLFVTPPTFSASVHENLLPGGSIFSDSQVVDSGAAGAAPSVDLLHRTDRGVNGSGRSTQISQGFASAQADAHGNGGVGVSDLLFGPAQQADSVDQLAAEVLWTQTFTDVGASDIALSASLHVPGMEVGLIGVAPNRSAPSATEDARAVVSLQTSINRADGSLVNGRSFTFGLHLHERQLFLAPGHFVNFAELQPIVTGSALGFDPFDHFHDLSVDDSVPRFTIDPLSFDFTLGTMHPGDILSYVYSLTAVGTTLGFEHGHFAFIGDPFDLGASGGGLAVTAREVTAAVPEPATWALILTGFLLLTGLIEGGKRRRIGTRARQGASTTSRRRTGLP